MEPAVEHIDSPSPRLLTLRGASLYLNVTERHLRGLVHRGAVPYYKVGRLLRFDPVELDGWLEQHRGGRAA